MIFLPSCLFANLDFSFALLVHSLKTGWQIHSFTVKGTRSKPQDSRRLALERHVYINQTLDISRYLGFLVPQRFHEEIIGTNGHGGHGCALQKWSP